MKFYEEEQMYEVREALEREILRWPEVSMREMMGCLTYFRGKKFFALLVTKGIVITRLSEDDRTRLSKMGGEVFKMAGKTVKTWTRMKLGKPKDLKDILPYVKKSYEAAGASTS